MSPGPRHRLATLSSAADSAGSSAPLRQSTGRETMSSRSAGFGTSTCCRAGSHWSSITAATAGSMEGTYDDVVNEEQLRLRSSPEWARLVEDELLHQQQLYRALGYRDRCPGGCDSRVGLRGGAVHELLR